MYQRYRKFGKMGERSIPAISLILPIASLEVLTNKPFLIKAMGHGTSHICRTDWFCFPSGSVLRNKFVKGFKKSDIVKAAIASGKKMGESVGRVALGSTVSFNISASEWVQGMSHKYCKIVRQKEGYSYAFSDLRWLKPSVSFPSGGSSL